MKKLFNLIIIFVLYFGMGFSAEDSRQEILNVLQKWPQDFNSKNVEATCGLFAPDLIASYQGASDKNYEEMCNSLRKALNNSDKTFTYKAPLIEQIMVQGDMGVVRLIWTSKVIDKNSLKSEIVKEKGLDVFKRQKDGSWKIVISYAYPISEV